MSNVKKRILQYIDSKGITMYQLYQKTGIANSILTRDTGISENNILKFIKEFPEVDIDWLITGNKKGLPKSVKERQDQPVLQDLKRKRLPSKNATKLEAIHDEMRSMLYVIHELKDEIRYQKKVIDSISFQINLTSDSVFKPARKAIFKSKTAGKLNRTFPLKAPPKP